MVSLSSVTVRLLPETRRGMYSVCDALGGERTGSEGPPIQALTTWSLHYAQSSAGHAAFQQENTTPGETAQQTLHSGRAGAWQGPSTQAEQPILQELLLKSQLPAGFPGEGLVPVTAAHWQPLALGAGVDVEQGLLG